MVKEFQYRGLTKEDLDNTSLEKLFLLFNSRQRRSLTRGITDGKRKLIEEIKSSKAGKLKNPIKTHSKRFDNSTIHGWCYSKCFLRKRISSSKYYNRNDWSIFGRICHNKQEGSTWSTRCRCIKIQPLRTVEVIIMGRFDYAFQNYDATRHVRSSVREKDMSHKHAREVAVAIKGLSN